MELYKGMRRFLGENHFFALEALVNFHENHVDSKGTWFALPSGKIKKWNEVVGVDIHNEDLAGLERLGFLKIQGDLVKLNLARIRIVNEYLNSEK